MSSQQVACSLLPAGVVLYAFAKSNTLRGLMQSLARKKPPTKASLARKDQDNSCESQARSVEAAKNGELVVWWLKTATANQRSSIQVKEFWFVVLGRV